MPAIIINSLPALQETRALCGRRSGAWSEGQASGSPRKCRMQPASGGQRAHYAPRPGAVVVSSAVHSRGFRSRDSKNWLSPP